MHSFEFTKKFLALGALVLMASPAQALEYTFKSKLDVFTVDVTDGGATYNGETVSRAPFVQVRPLFDVQMEDGCETKLSRPDLTITRKRGENEEKRLIYLEQKMMSDGKNCAEVTGHGIYQLPLHHNWFVDNKKVTIGLGEEFSIWKDGKQVVAFKKTAGRWRNMDPNFFTNWTFFEKFTDVVREFNIDFRAHPGAAKGVSKFELKQGARTFTFVDVGSEKNWGVQFPGSPWIAVSGNFALFDGMGPQTWTSPLVTRLKIVKDKTAKDEKRITAIRSLNSEWGPDVKYVFLDVLLTDGENLNIKREIANMLKPRPTDEHYGALADSLKMTDDREYQEAITKILRVRNPKGATIFADDEDEDAAKKLKMWLEWRKTLKN